MRVVPVLSPKLDGVVYPSRRAAERTRATQRAQGVQLGVPVKLGTAAHEARPIQ